MDTVIDLIFIVVFAVAMVFFIFFVNSEDIGVQLLRIPGAFISGLLLGNSSARFFARFNKGG